MAGRPQQPKCECGKSLYKRMDPGSVKTSDPYGWCRNKKCSRYNVDQSGESRFSPLEGEPVGTAPTTPTAPAKPESDVVDPAHDAKRQKSLRKSLAKTKAKKEAPEAPEPESEGDEPEAVRKARARIKKVVEAAKVQFGTQTVGLVLAICSQETGNHDAANQLIAEYNLTERFGIEPQL